MDTTLEKEVNRLGRSSRIAAGITLLGVAGVALALAYATSQLHTLEEKVAASKTQLETLGKDIKAAEEEKQKDRGQISELKSQVDTLQNELKETTDMSRFMHSIDMVDLKHTAVENLAAARVLQQILELRANGVGWKLGGTNPNEGFDSPSFATYVLQSLHLITSNEHTLQGDLPQKSSMLRSALPRAAEPKIGDLVFYAGGYALFFFLDQRGRSFVIGMTPMGIVALEPNFASREGVARPNYKR